MVVDQPHFRLDIPREEFRNQGDVMHILARSLTSNSWLSSNQLFVNTTNSTAIEGFYFLLPLLH